MPHNPKRGLAVIILNWNAAADTIQCVRQIDHWRKLKATVWIVDNASADGSAEEIAGECPRAHLIRNARNLGYAGGNNRGIAQALAAQSDLVLLLNNDSQIEEQDLLRLVSALDRDQHIGIVGPLLYDADHKKRLLAAGGRDPVLHHHSHIQEFTQGEAVRAVDYVPGTVLLARSAIFAAVGLLDEAYFFNAEIADLCKRARLQGHLCVIDTRARAFHALERRPSHLRSTLYTYYVIRNRFLYIRKFYRWSRIPLTVFWTSYSLALSLKLHIAGYRATALCVRLGLTDGLRGRFGGQNERVLGLLKG